MAANQLTPEMQQHQRIIKWPQIGMLGIISGEESASISMATTTAGNNYQQQPQNDDDTCWSVSTGQ